MLLIWVSTRRNHWRPLMVCYECYSWREPLLHRKPNSNHQHSSGRTSYLRWLPVWGRGLLDYLRQNKRDPWIYLDAAGPAILIGQAIGRIANFINQELYGPPTTFHGESRFLLNTVLPNVDLFPVATTRSTRHSPTKCIWNLFTAGLLLWFPAVIRRSSSLERFLLAG